MSVKAPRKVAVFWDVDNIGPGKAHKALLTAIRLKLLVQKFAGPVSNFAAYGNSVTLSKSNKPLQHSLSLAGVQTHVVQVSRDSADILLKSHLIKFAQANLDQGIVAIVSSDAGYLQTVRRCRSLGCSAIALGKLGKWDPVEYWKWRKAAMAKEVDLAVHWSWQLQAEASKAEKEALQALLKKASIPEIVERALEPTTTAATAVATWSQPSGAPYCAEKGLDFSKTALGSEAAAVLTDMATGTHCV